MIVLTDHIQSLPSCRDLTRLSPPEHKQELNQTESCQHELAVLEDQDCHEQSV